MKQFLKFVQMKPTWLFLVAVSVTLLAGFSGLVYSSTYAPLYFLGIVFIVAVFFLWLQEPTWALFTAILIVFLPNGLIPATLQSTLNRLMTIVVFAIWLYDLIVRRRKVFLTSTATLMLGFIAWSLLSLLWAENRDAAQTTLQVYIMRFLLFVFLIPNQIRTLKNLNGLMFTMALSGWLFLLVSIITLIQQGYTPGSRFKVYGMNENEAGVMAILMMVGVLWIASQSLKRHKAVTILITCIFIATSMGFIALSGSRGGAISLFITLLVFLAWRSSRMWGIFGFLVLLLTIIVLPTVFITTLERFTSTTDTFLGGREVLWVAALRMISQHPIGGVGIGNSPFAIAPYLAVPESTGGIEGISAHNPILAVWSETGILGIILYLGILVSAIYSFIKQYLRYKKTDLHNKFTPYFAFVTAAFLGYIASWVKGGGMQIGYSYFFVIALLLIPSSLEGIDVLSEYEE